MAVEIKEIVVKAIIVDDQDTRKKTKSKVSDAAEQSKMEDTHSKKEDLIQACVDQVLKILNKRSLR